MSISPGSTLAVLGGGQLGRMFVHAAQRLGYRVWVLEPDADSPAGRAADRHLVADYTDAVALNIIRTHCAAVSVEFENVPASALETLAQSLAVRPSPAAVAAVQSRYAEKQLFLSQAVATVDHMLIRDINDIAAAASQFSWPAILKTDRYGYDGKGQTAIASAADLRDAWDKLGQVPTLLEQRVCLDCEVSVVLARDASGNLEFFPVAENQHCNGVLVNTVAPARIGAELVATARHSAQKIAEALDYVGVLAVEFFVTSDKQLLANEIAPRPHNSGHFSLDACSASQFEQQVRALCGLPLAQVAQCTPVAMVNLLGDLWSHGEPDWQAVWRAADAHLHLYGKAEARPGRKMGHINILANDLATAIARGEVLTARLKRKASS